MIAAGFVLVYASCACIHLDSPIWVRPMRRGVGSGGKYTPPGSAGLLFRFSNSCPCGTWPPRRLSLLSLSVHFGRLWSLQLAWQLRTIRGAIAAAPIPHALLRQFQESRRQRKLLLLMRWPSFLKTCVAASCLDKKKPTKITFDVELVQIQHTIVPIYNTDCSAHVLLSVCVSES